MRLASANCCRKKKRVKQNELEPGGKPSTRFPPERLVELIRFSTKESYGGRAQLVLRSKLKDNLNNFDLNFTVCENLASSFCNLTIFPEDLSEIMSACKARAPDEGGMMNPL